MHHGILGQKWGVRRFEDKNGRLTSAGKERYGKGRKREKSEDETKTKEKFWTEDRIKKAAKVGAIAVGSAIVAYGGYKLATDPHVRSAIADGMSKLKNEPSIEEMIQNSGPEIVKKSNQMSNSGSVVESSKYNELSKDSKLYDILNDKNPTGDLDNCKELAATATCRAHGINVVAQHAIDTPNSDLQHSFEDVYGIYDKVKPVYSGGGDSQQFKSNIEKHILKNYKEGDVGCIAFGYNERYIEKFKEKYGKEIEGHAFNWVIENGKVTFACSQQGYPKDMSSEFLNINTNKEALVVMVTEEMAKKISQHYGT